MKTFQLFTTLFALMFVIGCSNDSDDNPAEDSRPVDRSANLLGTGRSANDILSNSDFTKLKIEIAYVTGFRPTQDALDNFIDFLRQHTFKEEIELVFLELPSPDKEELTIQEIADLETENRTVYNDGDTLGVYIYFADAPSDGDEEDVGLVTLGAVYRNTSMVIHEITIRRLAGGNFFITTTDIEVATINHEFGHLFGLVNLGTPVVNDHEDIEAPNHCNVEGCLMRAELQFGSPNGKSEALTAKNELKSSCSLSGKSLVQMLENNAAKGLENSVPLREECILDLQGNGGR